MVNRKDETVSLTDEDIEELLPWFGYGHFKEVNIVFLGNEEGLGGYPIEATLARTRVYGKCEKTWLTENWEDGYWDETGYAGYLKLGEVTNQIRAELGLSPFVKEKEGYFPILDFQARLLLSLEEPDNDWFQLKGWYSFHDPAKGTQLKNTIRNLYSNTRKFKAGLVDWRPLPRPDENSWPYTGIDKKRYLDAFSLKRPYYENVKNVLNERGLQKDIDLDPYSTMLYKRVTLMKNVLSGFPFSLLIGAGAVASKKRLLQLIFNDQRINFKKKPLSGGKKYEIADIKVRDRSFTVLLTPFFNHRKNCLQLTGLKELVDNVIKPMLSAKSKSEEAL